MAGAACEPEFNSTKFPENYSALARRKKFSAGKNAFTYILVARYPPYAASY